MAAVWTASCSLPPSDTDESAEREESSALTHVDCTGTIAGGTITGNVKVAPGAICTLNRVQVEGSVEAAEGSDLRLFNSRVKGHLKATAVKRLGVFGSVITHNLESHRGASVAVAGSTINGDVILDGTGTRGVPQPFSNTLCGSTITGNATVKNSAGPVLFEVGVSEACSRGNRINGSLRLEHNAATLNLEDNTVLGKVTCQAAGGKAVVIPTSGLVVLPGGSCGTKTCIPGCDGQLLTSCDHDANATLKDCAEQADSTGNPMTCEFLADQDSFDCIADFSRGCGDETIAGRCNGTTVIHCLSDDSGNAAAKGGVPVNLEVIDCALDPAGLTTCAVAPDGMAGCAAPGTVGCGEVTADGACNGELLSRCVSSAVQTTNCSATGTRCGLASTGIYACLDPALFNVPPAAIAVTGTFVYEKRTVDTSTFQTAQNGFLATPVLTPVRRALVRLLAASDNHEIERAFTDDNGSFTLPLPAAPVLAFVTVATSGDPTRQPLTVRDCPPPPTGGTFPTGCMDQLGNVYVFQSPSFTGPAALGQLTITEASGVAGAFNIFNLMLKGQEFARVNFNNEAFPSTPDLLVEWRKGFRTTTSLWNRKMVVIQGNGRGGDTDEFDDTVLMHELGHFLQDKFSIDNSPGGTHGFRDPSDPRLAFGEGYGTYIGSRISGSSIYFDTSGSGISVSDINATGLKADPDDLLGIKQLISEALVAEILWRIDFGTGGNTAGAGGTDAQGSTPIFDVLGRYFRNNPSFNNTHGVTGRDLVKFLDGWFCRDFNGNGAASTAVLQRVVTTDHGFPYDDFTHQLSPIGLCK